MSGPTDAHAPAAERVTRTPNAIPVSWMMLALHRERRFILVLASVGFTLSVLLALAKTPSYTATFSFVPQSNQDQARSGLASLAGQFGISLGAAGGPQQPSQLYADLLRTREVLAPIAADSFAVGSDGRKFVRLADFLKITAESPAFEMEQTIDVLRRGIITSSVETRTTGVVTVRARTGSREVSLQIAQRLLDGLNRFNRITRQSQAAEERRFTEGRLAAAQSSLRVAEDALQSFLQSNRQFSNAPVLLFQRDRLQREVALRQQVVLGISQQNEDARIREVRDTPVITVIERPVLPVLRDPMGRVRMVLLWTMAAFVLGVAVVLGRAGRHWQLGRGQGDAPEASLPVEWRFLRGRRGSA